MKRLDPWLIAAAALALIPVLTIARPGIPHTADGYVHILRTLEVSELLQEGILFPRWAPHFYLGYGYPFFNFYASGSHWLAAAAALAGLGVLRGVVALQVLALLLYPTGAYLAARSLFPAGVGGAVRRPAALVAAALYLYAPFRFRELFIQGNLSQLLALALLPWCAWLLITAILAADLRRSAVAGVALAGLVYAHHPSAFLGFPFLAAFALGVALVAGRRGGASLGARLAAAAAAFVLGVLLSAPFWLPSLVELGDVNISAIATGMFNARLNLLPVSELLSPPRLLDDAALNPVQPNSLGLAQTLLALAGLFVALRWVLLPLRTREPSTTTVLPWWGRHQAGWVLLVLAGLLAFSLALMLPPAAGVWDRLPLARFIAFPWRLLGPALLCAALLGGAALYLVPLRLQQPALVALLLLIPLSVALYLFPRPFSPVAEPSPASIAAYELAGGARATASANEYLPRWVNDPNPPLDQALKLREGQSLDPIARDLLPDGSTAIQLAGGALFDSYRLDLPAASNVRLRRFYFPGWRAWVDGQPTPITPDPIHGLIEVAITAGSHDLEVRFGATPPRLAGSILALLGLAGVVMLWWWGAHRGRIDLPADAGDARTGWRPVLPALVAILVLTVLVLLVIGPQTRWFRQRSPVEAPATMQVPLHIRFTNGIELLGYDLGDQSPRQGETVSLRLYWRPLQPQTTDVRPFIHLDSVIGDVTWANQTKTHPGDKPASSWPLGFYVVDDYRLLMPPDTPPLAANLRTGLIGPDGQLVPITTGGDTATLARVTVRERDPLKLASVPGRGQVFQLGDAIHLLGREVRLTDAVSTDGTTGPALNVTLYWQAADTLPADYTVFTTVLDAQGQRVAQIDGPPAGGRYPTSAWTPGQIVADSRLIPLPPGVDPAGLRVAVGLYTQPDGARLAITDPYGARLPDDQVILLLNAP